MFRAISLLLIFSSVSHVYAGLDADKASFVTGTTQLPYKYDGAVEGSLDLDDVDNMVFVYRDGRTTRTFAIPYSRIQSMEYGQKAGRRIAAAIATGVIVAPAGVLLLLSKKTQHFLTINYRDKRGMDQAVMFELGKDIVRPTLSELSKRSGKKVELQRARSSVLLSNRANNHHVAFTS